MMTRGEFEALEDGSLAPYAMRNGRTRGRVHAEPEHPFRLPFQRDRDRMIHSSAFRRLEYKTQVFVNHEGDYYRTRLTHTIEAAQITRTIARALGLNEDLGRGGRALARPRPHAVRPCRRTRAESADGAARRLRAQRQSLRIVDVLEERYPDFPGPEPLAGRCARASSSTPREYDRPLVPAVRARREARARGADRRLRRRDRLQQPRHRRWPEVGDARAPRLDRGPALARRASTRCARDHGREPERCARYQTIARASSTGSSTDMIEATARRIERAAHPRRSTTCARSSRGSSGFSPRDGRARSRS